jgi:hypothetical protein
MANFILPYEAQSADHRIAERQQRETKEWLRQRSIDTATEVPSIVPKARPEDDKGG